MQYTLTGTVSVFLPGLTTSLHGKPFHIKDADYNAFNNNLTIYSDGSDTIEGTSSYIISVNGNSLSVRGNDTTKNWEVF